MANYDSNYTGRQIDDSVNFTESFNRTPTEIETTLDKFDSISSTPTNIDNAVNYLTILEGEVTPSQIRMCYDYFNSLTVTTGDINSVVAKFNDVNSTPAQIDNTVNSIVNNNATLGQILTSDGNGGSIWETPITSPSLYHHIATWTKVGQWISRWAVEWVDAQSNSSINATTALFTLQSYYRNKNCPKIISGDLTNDEGASATFSGFYFESATGKYVLVSSEQELAEEKFDNFNEWTYAQSTRQII